MRRFNNVLATIVAAASLCLAACGGGGDTDPDPLPTPTAPAAGTLGDGRLAELAEWARTTQNAPAMAVVLVRNGQVVERAAVGRRATSNPMMVSLDDRWHIGSMTKAMTATLAAVLVEDGLIDWDTTPLEVWPELESSIHANYRDVTLRQLLAHASGMQRDEEYRPASDSAPGTVMQKRREWAAHLLQGAAEFRAGEYHYSNVGYMVAGAMLETRAGALWETLLTTRVFAPLGMTQTGFGAPGTSGQFDQPLGHWSRSSGFDPIDPASAEANIPAALGAAGNVHTTLNDYTHFMLAHIAGARGTPNIISVTSFQTLHAPVTANYSLGWEPVTAFQTLNAPGLVHTGSTGRWFSLVWLAPTLDAGLMIAVNGGGERAFAAIQALDLLMRQRLMASP
jgi:CubicO group peptidase (beta-lactamase class C family)